MKYDSNPSDNVVNSDSKAGNKGLNSNFQNVIMISRINSNEYKSNSNYGGIKILLAQHQLLFDICR